MVGQSLFEKQRQKIQSELFQYIMSETTDNFERFVVNLSLKIKDILEADSCAIYLIDEWKGHFLLYSEDHKKMSLYRDHFSKDDLSEDLRCLSDMEKTICTVDLQYPLYIAPLQSGGTTFGYLVLNFNQNTLSFDSATRRGISSEISKCIKKWKSYYTTIEEKKKYELLYKITSHFHSSIDIDGVLKEIIASLRKTYPAFEYYLLLSRDCTTNHQLPVRELTYDMNSGSSASTQAYLTGEVQMEDNFEDQQSYLYAPLKGKQGIYGVLQIVTPSYLYFPKKDVEFFIFIANTAGKALENAQLYQQSRELNSDLQLINATSQKLNSNTRLTEKISYMAYKIQQSFQADEVGFISYDGNDGFKVLEGSTGYFTSSHSHSLLHSIEDMVMEQKEPLFIGDVQTTSLGVDLPFRSLMAVPMKDHEHMSGLAVILQKDAYFFSFESFKLLQSLVSHSTLAFANSLLREELEKAVITDYLTKLHSRVYLDQYVEASVENDENGHLILFDIDNFKRINDTHGHQVGDEVICQVAGLIRTSIGNVGLAARWGGEELAVYLPSIPSEHAHELTEMIREKVATFTSPSVTVSCGLASWEASWVRPTLKRIVQQADQALYKAKGSGKNRIVTAPL